MTDQPLSVTHPVLWNVFQNVPAPNGSEYYTMPEIMDVIQSCTVDIVSHEYDIERILKLCDEKDEELERVKKELETLTSNMNIWGKTLYDNGVKEGERRAMERVKETILKLDKDFSKGAFQPTLRSLYRELGLGEDVQQ
jgi:hypothetical protein